MLLLAGTSNVALVIGNNFKGSSSLSSGGQHPLKASSCLSGVVEMKTVSGEIGTSPSQNLSLHSRDKKSLPFDDSESFHWNQSQSAQAADKLAGFDRALINEGESNVDKFSSSHCDRRAQE